ncbi:MAG: hypothetical protein H0X24_01230 [Ktedonobacterales bacterium]|nr:hypothetical protein [Ktedonobacterales bacterium]
MKEPFDWHAIPEWLAGTLNDAAALRRAYQDAAQRQAYDVDVPLCPLLWTNQVEFVAYHDLANALSLPWPMIATRFWQGRERHPSAPTTDLLWDAFHPAWPSVLRHWEAVLELHGITLRVERQGEVWQLIARVDFVMLSEWQVHDVPTAGYLVAAAARAATLYVIRSKAAFPLPLDQAARILSPDALATFKATGYYVHPVARDLTSAAAVLARWEQWTDEAAAWLPLHLAAGGTFVDGDGQLISLLGMSFAGLVGTRQDGRDRIRDYRRYTYRYRRDCGVLSLARMGQRVALLYA